MLKVCRVKVLTKRPRKRSGFCGKKGKKDVNKDVNNVTSDDVNIENSVNDDDSVDQNDLSANISTASDKKS